jgi:hypothetical protein
MAAYGLYTHIASNKVRSMLLLGGLFLLVYVMIFAGALLAKSRSTATGRSTPISRWRGAISSRRFRSPPSAPHGS